MLRNKRCGGRAAAATDGDDEHIDVRSFFEHLERGRRDPRDEVRLVARVDVAQPPRGRETLALDARLVVVGAVLDDGCAMRAHCRDLDGISAAGHDDRHRDPEGLPGVRERLAVITGRRRDHAVARGRVATEKVEPTADLERRGR